MGNLDEIFDFGTQLGEVKCKKSFLKDAGINIEEWFDAEVGYHEYEKVAQDTDSIKEQARKKRYPVLQKNEMMLIFALQKVDSVMAQGRIYFFLKQWQNIAMSLRREVGAVDCRRRIWMTAKFRPLGD